jgi:hypothetical protein
VYPQHLVAAGRRDIIDIIVTVSTGPGHKVTLSGNQVDGDGSISVNPTQRGCKIRFTVAETCKDWTFPAGALSAPGLGHYFNGIWIRTADPKNQFSKPDRSPHGGIVSFLDLDAGDGGTQAAPVIYMFDVFLVNPDGETTSTDPGIKNQT